MDATKQYSVTTCIQFSNIFTVEQLATGNNETEPKYRIQLQPAPADKHTRTKIRENYETELENTI